MRTRSTTICWKGQPCSTLRRTSHGFGMRGSQRHGVLADSFHHLHQYSVFHSVTSVW